jgi:hypothetical protein
MGRRSAFVYTHSHKRGISISILLIFLISGSFRLPMEPFNCQFIPRACLGTHSAMATNGFLLILHADEICKLFHDSKCYGGGEGERAREIHIQLLKLITSIAFLSAFRSLSLFFAFFRYTFARMNGSARIAPLHSAFLLRFFFSLSRVAL